MLKIVKIDTPIKSLKLIEPKKFSDQRGFFMETFNKQNYSKIGIIKEFVQDNQSVSKKEGTIRGLHFQEPPYDQAKLVRCSKGAIFDVAVDLRVNSPSYSKWFGCNLTHQNGHQLFIPSGFAHGFITLQDNSEIIYKCTNYYHPESEKTLLWNDPDIGIKWPHTINQILNIRDTNASSFKNLNSPFICKQKK